MSEARRLAFQARVAHDLAAAHSAALVVIGDRLGLYRALAAEPLTPLELARRTGTHERYVREWLRNQAAGGYVQHDPAGGTYALGAEQAAALAQEDGPAFAVPAFQLAAGLGASLDAVAEAFRTGAGLAPGAYGGDVAAGIARGSRALWLPRLAGWLPGDVGARLREGGAGADLGCGDGEAVWALADAFPRARFAGVDVDPSAIERASRARPASDRVRFVAGSAEALPERAFDLVVCIDALHDLPDPRQAAARVRASLAPGGCALVVEPCVEWAGGPDVLARLLSAVSSMYCVPVGRSGGGEGRGALGGEPDLLELLAAAGFAPVRVVERLPLHVVVEARR